MFSLVLLATSAYAIDPLQNAGFETGDFTGWSHWGDATAVLSEAPYEGSYEARLTLDPTETGFQQTGLYQDVANAVSGEHLQFTVLARVPTTDPVTMDGRLIVKWEAGSLSGQANVPLATDGSWTYGKVEVMTPTDATSLRYTLLFEASQAGADGIVFVDDLRISSFAADFCPDPFDQSVDTDADGSGDTCDLCTGDDATGDADDDGVCADQDDCDDASGCVPADTDTGAGEGDDLEGDDLDNGCGCDHAAVPSMFAPLALLALAAGRRRTAAR